jgi:hypothetical protein
VAQSDLLVARVFPGRSTTLPIFIDDSMFSVVQDDDAPPNDPCGGTIVIFDQDRFNSINEPPIKGFVNDYVSFDISSMPAALRPTMSPESGGALVGRIFLTGDNWAVSGVGDSGKFEVLTEQVSQPIVGNYGPPGTIGGSTHPGTFTLEQLDPTDLFNLRKIVALQGIWREHDAVITGLESWNLVAFPSTDDANEQEAVLFKMDGGQVTDLYFGFVNYDTDLGEFFPVKSLVTGLSADADKVTIAIRSQVDRNGSPTAAAQLTRRGLFEVTGRGALPADAPSTGNYLVFRI